MDGCGAPLLSDLADRAGPRLPHGCAGGRPDGPESARVAEAIRAHPAYVSGTHRDERALLTAIPGAIGKAGAESCYAVALPDGRAFALKTDDGAARARPVLMAEALRRSACDRRGRRGRRGGDPDRDLELLGGGRPVGEIRAAF